MCACASDSIWEAKEQTERIWRTSGTNFTSHYYVNEWKIVCLLCISCDFHVTCRVIFGSISFISHLRDCAHRDVYIII